MLSVKNLVFGHNTSLCTPISFELAQGCVLAVLGANGRGKTTLLHTLLGSLSPQSGELYYHAKLGYVPQSCQLNFAYTALDVVLMGLAQTIGLFFHPSKSDEDRAYYLLQQFGIESLSTKIFNQLSGGQQQLVLLARALIADAEIILLDEPTSALDFSNQKKVLQCILRLAKQEDKCIIFTTHDPYHAQLVADDCLLLLPEKQWAFSPKDEILNEQMLHNLYGVPLKKFDISSSQKAILPLFDIH